MNTSYKLLALLFCCSFSVCTKTTDIDDYQRQGGQEIADGYDSLLFNVQSAEIQQESMRTALEACIFDLKKPNMRQKSKAKVVMPYPVDTFKTN